MIVHEETNGVSGVVVGKLLLQLTYEQQIDTLSVVLYRLPWEGARWLLSQFPQSTRL